MYRWLRWRPWSRSMRRGESTKRRERRSSGTCRRATPMATNYPDVIPMIAYEDGLKAMDWLASAFGFKERARMLDDGGRLSHGEMQAGDGVVMLGTPTPGYQAPPHHPEACRPAPEWATRPHHLRGG